MNRIENQRETCRENLRRARFQVGDPERALWPTIKGSMRDDDHAAAARLHSSVSQFALLLREKTSVDSARWHDRVVDEHEFPDGATLPVTLYQLGEWEDISYKDSNTGKLHSVHLPVAYARELFRKADALAREHDLVDAEHEMEEFSGKR